MLVIVQNWKYGPGIMDGIINYSIHESIAEWRKFITWFYRTQPEIVLKEYYFPDGAPYWGEVSDSFQESLPRKKPGLWWYGSDPIPVTR